MHEPSHRGPRHGGGRFGALGAWAGWWVLCAALWLALVDRVALDELVTGAVAAACGATAAVLVRAQRRILAPPPARRLAAAWRSPLALVGDLWPLGRALVARGVLRRRERGVVYTLALDVASDAPDAVAYRVLTAALGSLGPNTIVLDIDAQERVVHAHQLVPTDDAASAAMPLRAP